MRIESLRLIRKNRDRIVWRYATAILLSLAALYMRWLLTPVFGSGRNPYHTAWLAVVVAAWYLGLGPSILTVIIQTVAVWYYFLPPANSFHLQGISEVGGLLGFVVLSSLIVALGEANRRSLTEKRNAQTKLDADLQAMMRLQEVGNLCVREKSDLVECLGAILDAAVEITGAAKGNIQLLDRASRTLRIAASRGFGEPFLKFFEQVSDNSCACGTAMLSHERVIVEDVTQSRMFADKPSLGILLDSGVRAVQSTPLVSSSGRLLGMISTHFSQPHRPSEQELRFLDLLVRQAADYLERKEAESRLLEQAHLLDESHDAILVLGTENRITYWNKGATEVYGYSRDEALGCVAHELLRTVFPEPIDQIKEKVRQTASWSGELIHTRKDDVKIIISSRWVLSQTERPSILEINRDISDLKQTEADLRESRQELEQRVKQRTRQLLEANKDLSTLSGRLLQAQDDERRRLARELHDSAGQLLAALGINVSQLERGLPEVAPKLSPIAKESQALVQQLTQDIRTTSYLLHPPLLEESGLPSALTMYVDGLAERSGIKISLTISESFGRLSQNAELAIFRVVQESLTNIHRHSGSKTASVRLLREPKTIFLEIRDQGRGIDSNTLNKIQTAGGGVGIAGMRQRIRHFGGNIKIESTGKGTTIALTLPLTTIAIPERRSTVARAQAV